MKVVTGAAPLVHRARTMAAETARSALAWGEAAAHRVRAWAAQVAGLVGARARAKPAAATDPISTVVDEVDQARREWQAAQLYFQNVGEPELIDQAIHWMTAAERRYVYLLRKAREERVASPFGPHREAEGGAARHAGLGRPV